LNIPFFQGQDHEPLLALSSSPIQWLSEIQFKFFVLNDSMPILYYSNAYMVYNYNGDYLDVLCSF